ncbi:type II secretion system F family protein [Dongshaea marina]|uniref:type II secretion system F family protein n=1 Tax=Dongshaea marina TaxID=2047966 RepID=UPI000D3EC934|nr:type II secretion system F family protein [Dongshaea marina]
MATAAPARKAKIQKKIYPFSWKGVNRKGHKVSGELQSDSIASVKQELKKQGVTATRVTKKSQSLFAKYGDKVTPMDIAVISRQITTMLTAGVPLVQTLQLIAGSHEKASARQLIGQIAADVETGTPLSEALRKFPRQFDDLYCDLVEAGEQSGALETIYDRVATYKEKAEILKSKIKKALFYPVTVIIVAIGVTSILLLFVIPQFEEIFQSFGAELPAFTKMVIAMSRFMQDYWYLLFGGVIIIVVIYVQSHRHSQRVRNRTDIVLLGLPIVGIILHKAAMARFARTLSTTFAAGIPLVDALVSSASASGNYVYRSAIMSVRTEVIAGMQMNVAMRTCNLFPDMLIQMVMIGEESGAIDEMLDKIANIYEQEVDDAIDGLTSLIEPLIMVVLGTLVGGMVVAMYLPIFQMGSVVG